MDAEKIDFYRDLVDHHNAFLMDTNLITASDQQLNDDWWEEVASTHWDHVIYVNSNFLSFNPIYDFNHQTVYDQLIFDPFVLNILFPERFLDDEEVIEAEMLQMFEGWMNPYLIENGLMGQEELVLNLIHVPDGQYYFSFNPFLRPADGHRVRDPIAIIYDEKFADPHFIPAALAHSVYFVSEHHDPFSEIEDLVDAHGLTAQIRGVESVYDQHTSWIGDIQAYYFRLIGLLILLIVSHIAVTYNLTANYFERHKFETFLKSTLGYHIFKRNKLFFMTYVGYTVPLIIFMVFFQGWYVLLVGMAILAFDMGTMMLFERRLLRKSFSEIMKGER